MDATEFLQEIVCLQKEYENLVRTKKLSKKAMCNLVIPFRDKFHLTDHEALAYARNEVPLEKIATMVAKSIKKEEIL